MSYSRRKFITETTMLGLGIPLLPAIPDIFFPVDKKIKRFGLQLYTLRDALPANPRDILKQVASFGYKEIESYEGKDGMFWGMGNKGFRRYLDDLGMEVFASHCDIEKDFERKANEAAAIGMKHLYCAWKGPQKSINSFRKFAEEFNACGEICRKAGLRFGYHNHDYSFKELDGEIPQDVLMKNTDPALVDFEMDIYWVITAGHDPVQWFNRYPGRFKSCHIKDRALQPGTDNYKNSVDLGKGSIDFKPILKAGEKLGLENYVVEQEFYPGGSSINAVAANAAYMKGLRI